MCEQHEKFQGFGDLDDFDSAPARPAQDQQRFVCPSCQGTGKYRGVRVHQERSDCFACRGRGYFLTSPQQRAKARRSRVEKKAAARKSWCDQNREVVQFLSDAGQWSDFARSLSNQIVERGSLSEKQLVSARSMMEKVQANRARRQREARESESQLGDLAPILAVFDKAPGGRRLVLRIGSGLKISRAPASGRNAGHLYVKDAESGYLGKVSPDGVWHPVRGVEASVADELREFAAHPLGAAKEYGRRTGQCCVCGRTLTNAASIEAGIGPICAEAF